VQKDQGKEAKLTEGLWRPELQRKEEDDDDRRRRGRALAEEGDAEMAGVLGLRRSAPGTPVEVLKGLRGTHERRRRRTGTAERLTGGGFVMNSRRYEGVGSNF
jgi:hypothetical protein